MALSPDLQHLSNLRHDEIGTYSRGENLWRLPVPGSSRTLRVFTKLAAHYSRCTTVTSGRTKRRTSVGYSHQLYSSFATSPIPTTISFPRLTAMVHIAPAMINLSAV